MNWEVLGWVLALISLIFGIYKHIQSEKKERLNERLNSLRESFEKTFKEMEKDIAQGSASYTLLEKRTRVIESRQITEQRVQSMLIERISPVEATLEKVEEKLERNHRELSTEIQVGLREQALTVSKVLERVNYMAGLMEARRENDNSHQPK